MKLPPLDRSLVNQFKKSLICNLSLSSKELFHSNFLSWALEAAPEFAKRFLDDKSPITDIRREKHNFDLLIETREKIHVIENKVKSIPDLKQILRYQDKANQTCSSRPNNKESKEIKIVLLSLMEPSQTFRKLSPEVRHIDYTMVSQWLSPSEFPTDHQSSIREYLLLLSILLSIKSIAGDMNPKASFYFHPTHEAMLREMRLFDVAQKIRYGCFSESIRSDIPLLKMDDSLIEFEVGMTQSIGLASFKIPITDTRFLAGVQIQGPNFRHFIESTPPDTCAQEAAEVLQKTNQPWLSGKLLKFGRPFKYTYERIPADINVESLREQTFNSLNVLTGRLEEFSKLLQR